MPSDAFLMKMPLLEGLNLFKVLRRLEQAYVPWVEILPLALRRRYQFHVRRVPSDRAPSKELAIVVSLPGVASQMFRATWYPGDDWDEFVDRANRWAFQRAAEVIASNATSGMKLERLQAP